MAGVYVRNLVCTPRMSPDEFDKKLEEFLKVNTLHYNYSFDSQEDEIEMDDDEDEFDFIAE
jgi:hypothetical protein